MDKNQVLTKLLNALIKKYKLSYKLPKTYSAKVNLYNKIALKREPSDLSEEILKLDDQYRRLELINTKLTNSELLKSINEEFKLELTEGDKVSLWFGDITTIYADAIVNSCNDDLSSYGISKEHSLDSDINVKSGLRLRIKSNKIMNDNKLKESEVFISRGYNLPCDFILQVYNRKVEDKLTDEDKEALRKTYLNILDCAKNNQIRNIVIPCISTGYNNFDIDQSIIIVVDTILNYLKFNGKLFNRIIIDTYTEDNYKKYLKFFKKLNKKES